MSEIILYTSPDGVAKIEVAYEAETFWLPQKRMAELFGVTVPTISEHLTSIFSSGELAEHSVVRNFRRTAAYQHYNLLQLNQPHAFETAFDCEVKSFLIGAG